MSDNRAPKTVSKAMRIGIVAGEASGDILGADLMKSILQYVPDCQFEGVGGDRMRALGFNSLYPMERLAVMGLVEPLKRLPELLGIRHELREHFISNPPDLFLGIDSPDFNLNLEGKLHGAGIVTAHYVSPSVWAWRQKRVFKIKKAVDLMLTLFPFEESFYRQHQVPVKYVGHPLADRFSIRKDQQADRRMLGLSNDTPVVALLPGSRGGEVKLMAKPFLETALWCLEKQPDLQFAIPAANAARRVQIERQLEQVIDRVSQLGHYGNDTIKIYNGQSHEVMSAADVVLMASGTTTLEAMLLKKPMVVAYRMAPLSFAIISRMVKSKYISLPNLLADKLLVPEILQNEVTAETLGKLVMERLHNPSLIQYLNDEFEVLHRQLQCNASEQAAVALLSLMNENNRASADVSKVNR